MHVKEPGSESITLVIPIFLIIDLTPTMRTTMRMHIAHNAGNNRPVLAGPVD